MWASIDIHGKNTVGVLTARSNGVRRNHRAGSCEGAPQLDIVSAFNHMVNTSKMKDSESNVNDTIRWDNACPGPGACGGVSTYCLDPWDQDPITGTQCTQPILWQRSWSSWHVVTRVLVIPCRVSGEHEECASGRSCMHHLLRKYSTPNKIMTDLRSRMPW